MAAADAASRPSEANYIAGEVKYMSTGSAPISSEVFEFLRVCFGATVSEGYGMTESACTIAMTRPDDATIGHVGAPLECCEIKLEDIPDMNYKNTDQPYPRGEVNPTAPFLHCLRLKLLLLQLCMSCMGSWRMGGAGAAAAAYTIRLLSRASQASGWEAMSSARPGSAVY